MSQGISQQKLANQIGIEFSQVGRIERGVINTSISTVYEIAKGLGISPHELFLPVKEKNKED